MISMMCAIRTNSMHIPQINMLVFFRRWHRAYRCATYVHGRARGNDREMFSFLSFCQKEAHRPELCHIWVTPWFKGGTTARVVPPVCGLVVRMEAHRSEFVSNSILMPGTGSMHRYPFGSVKEIDGGYVRDVYNARHARLVHAHL